LRNWLLELKCITKCKCCRVYVSIVCKEWCSYCRFHKFTGSKALQIGAFNIGQVLEMIRSVVNTKCSTCNDTVICVSWVFSNLAEARNFVSQLNIAALQLFVTVLESCITLLSAFVKSHKAVDHKMQSTRKEAVLLMICITLSAVR
jgi:hypothetical protein